MQLTPVAPPVFERVEFPDDPSLPQLPDLFDPDWVRAALRDSTPEPCGDPRRIRIHHFIHSIGRSAMVSYEVEWERERYLPAAYYVARIGRDSPARVFRYPDDRRLPGLADAAHAQAALQLVNQHVLTVPARRASVQLIRYRPMYRAVLRHKMGRVRFYARVVRPSEFESVLRACWMSQRSGFVVPGLAGHWAQGGVFWFSEVKGRNLRAAIRKGKLPRPDRLLDGLDALWRAPLPSGQLRPFDLSRAYRRALRSFRHHLRDSEAGMHALNAAVDGLGPFVRSWTPTCAAHNDFYDDQMLVLEDGKVALVDFEEIAAGEPMLDIGNFLAHLHWSATFSRAKSAHASRRYYQIFRAAALDRFAWDDRSLALREAVCLFRVCTNFIRHPRQNWRDKLESGLGLVGDLLG